VTDAERLRGVGVDLVDVDEVAASVSRYGERYLTRVYTRPELAAWGRSSPRLALCFAAKEAAIKALAPGDEAVPWTSIDVRPASGDALRLELSGASARLAARRGVDRLLGSAALAGEQAAAIVLAVGEADAGAAGGASA
jgi:holo-[acyl-carrier protein] synthase